MTRVIEKFNDTPVTELTWWQLIQYNVALTQANVASNTYVTGTINETIFAQYGITFEVVDKVVSL